MASKQHVSDVIVIGGGVIGLSISYELLRSKASVTSVFPRSGDNESASRAAGAMLGAFGEVTADDGDSETDELEFRIDAQRAYPAWLQEICERAGCTVHQGWGTFIIANNDGVCDLASIRRMKTAADSYYEPAEWVESEDIPGLNPSQHHSPVRCLHLEAEHSVDSAQLLDALIVCAAKFTSWTHVDSHIVDVCLKDNWIVTTASGQMVTAPHLVIAGGSRSLSLLPPHLRAEAGLPEMYFGKGVSCLVRGGPQIPQTIRTPNRAFACGIHVVPRSDGILYIGATNCMGTDHEAEKGVQPGELHNLFDEIIHQINTDIRCARIETIRMGYRPITSHRRPVIGETRIPRLSIATGTYRNGVLMAPKVAKIIAGVVGLVPATVNPFSFGHIEPDADLSRLASIGVRDLVSFLHEPRGSLPYNRANELVRYVRTLFEMSVMDGEHYDNLRKEIRRRLHDAPFNETMHKLFYDIVEQADVGAHSKRTGT